MYKETIKKHGFQRMKHYYMQLNPIPLYTRTGLILTQMAHTQEMVAD